MQTLVSLLPDTLETMETKGERIKRMREQRGLTQQQVADGVGVSRVAVTKWESGNTRNMQAENVLRLAEVLGVTADEIERGGSERGQRPPARSKTRSEGGHVGVGHQSVTLDLDADCLVVWRQLQTLSPAEREEWRARLDLAAATARMRKLGLPTDEIEPLAGPPPVPKQKRSA